MSTPEWNIFGRIEELEDIALKLMEKADITEPTLKDMSTVARDARISAEFGFILGFDAYIHYAPKPIELKDKLIGVFKKQGLSREILDSLEKFMAATCEDVEKKRK